MSLNYNFTFTRVSTRVTTRDSRGKCQKLPWKASFPRDGPWLFHVKTRGISRHVAFLQNESWNFHETSYRGISRGIFMRPLVMALKSQWLVKAFTIRNLFTIELLHSYQYKLTYRTLTDAATIIGHLKYWTSQNTKKNGTSFPE